MRINVSIVIPILNEADNIVELIDAILVQQKIFNFLEIIIVNDNSVDNTDEVMLKYREIKNIIYLKNLKREGQSKSIYNGVLQSKYNNIMTIDGDGQNDPKDFENLIKYYDSKNYFMISGIRNIRKDNIIKKISSKLANLIRSLILKDKCKDSACGLKFFSKEVFLKIDFFDGIHRFLPALFIACGVIPIYVNVNHKKRLKGQSKYGTIDRLTKGIIDLYKVKKLIKKLSTKK